jgi:hypothetical protein
MRNDRLLLATTLALCAASMGGMPTLKIEKQPDIVEWQPKYNKYSGRSKGKRRRDPNRWR